MNIEDIDTSNVDHAAVFLGFVALVGDIDRTALAFNLSPRVVRHLAEKNGWDDKIRSISFQNKSGKPGDFEKATNRALSFVTGHMLRSVISKIIENIHGMSRSDIVKTVIVQKGGGVTFSAGFYSDLSAALERCNSICFAALEDDAGGRTRAGKEAVSAELSVTALHAAISSALNTPAGAGAERALLEKETERIVRASVPPRPEDEKPTDPEV